MSDGMHAISFRHGDHICLFYNDINEQTAVAVPFVKAGLLQGERCLCVLTSSETDRLRSGLRRSGIDPEREISRGALKIATPERAYLANGKFQREAMIKLLDGAMRESLELGFTGFRGTGDLSWAARDTGICGQLPEYETMLAKYYPGTKSLGICMYDMRLFSPAQIASLVKAHRVAILHPDDSNRRIRIRRDRVFGDVIFDRAQPSSVFHYVVQKDESEEVLMSGQDNSLVGAMNAVEAAIAALPNG